MTVMVKKRKKKISKEERERRAAQSLGETHDTQILSKDKNPKSEAKSSWRSERLRRSKKNP
jgi:hypothetical protein